MTKAALTPPQTFDDISEKIIQAWQTLGAEPSDKRAEALRAKQRG